MGEEYDDNAPSAMPSRPPDSQWDDSRWDREMLLWDTEMRRREEANKKENRTRFMVKSVSGLFIGIMIGLCILSSYFLLSGKDVPVDFPILMLLVGGASIVWTMHCKDKGWI